MAFNADEHIRQQGNRARNGFGAVAFALVIFVALVIALIVSIGSLG